MQEALLQYVKKNGLRDTLCIVTALATAYAYGLIDEEQLLLTLASWNIPLDKILPTLVKLLALPPLMGITVFALNFTKNREHYVQLLENYRNSRLKQAFLNRLNFQPHENIIALIGSGAEFNIIYNSLINLNNNAVRSMRLLSVGITCAAAAAIQYLIVDGQSLIEARFPPFEAALRKKFSNWLAVISAYFVAILGAATMGLLAFNNSQQIFTSEFGHQGTRKAYADLSAAGVGMTYSGLDFTLYGLELVAFVIAGLRAGRIKHPKLNTLARKAKFVLALNAFLLMGIVGYGALTKFFFPNAEAPWWTCFPFLPLAFITGTQIYITECLRLIKLNGKIDINQDEENIEPQHTYRLINFAYDLLRIAINLGSSGLTLLTLSAGFKLPQNISTVSATMGMYAVTNIASSKIIERAESRSSNLFYNFSYSILLFVLASLAGWAWKNLLQSSYGVTSDEANAHSKYVGFLVACLLALAQKRIQPALKWPRFFATNQSSNERTPLINAATGDVLALGDTPSGEGINSAPSLA